MEETSKTAVFIDEIIFDGQTEQGVELDYVLDMEHTVISKNRFEHRGCT